MDRYKERFMQHNFQGFKLLKQSSRPPSMLINNIIVLLGIKKVDRIPNDLVKEFYD